MYLKCLTKRRQTNETPEEKCIKCRLLDKNRKFHFFFENRLTDSEKNCGVISCFVKG